MAAGSGEEPRALDHPAAVDLAGGAGEPPGAAADGASSISDPRLLVDRSDHRIVERRAPQIAASRSPHGPGRGAATQSKRLIKTKQVSGREIRAAEPRRGCGGIEPHRLQLIEA